MVSVDAGSMQQHTKLSKGEIWRLAELIAGYPEVRRQDLTDIAMSLLDDVPGLDVVKEPVRLAYSKKIVRLAVELRAGQKGRSRYPSANGDQSDDQDL